MTKKNELIVKILSYIRVGLLGPKDKLPSLRDFARENNVSLYTAISSYEELVSIGVVENRQKVGYFVLELNTDIDLLLRQYGRNFATKQQLEDRDDVMFYERYMKNMGNISQGDIIQLSSDYVNEAYYGNYTTICRDEIFKHMPLSNHHRFYEEVRHSLAASCAKMMLPYRCWFLRDHICFFSTPMCALLLSVLACRFECTDSSAVLGIEAPGNRYFRFCADMTHLPCCELRSDSTSGLCVEDLEQKLADGVHFFAVVIQSNYNDATGAILSQEKRRHLVEICNRNAITIIEYDCLGRTLNWGEKNIPVKGLDHDNTIYISDWGSVFGYHLPLAFAECGKYTSRIALLSNYCGFDTGIQEKLLLAHVITKQEAEGHMQRFNEQLAASAKMFATELKSSLTSGMTIYGEGTGPYLWIEMPSWVDGMDLVASLSRQRIHVAPGKLFSSQEGLEQYFRVNCCCEIVPERIKDSAATLSNAIATYFNMNKM